MNILLLKLLQCGLLALTMSLVIKSVRLNARATAAGRVVQYGWAVKALSCIMVVVLAIMVWQVLSGNPTATVTDWRVPAMFGTALIPTLWEVFIRRLIISDEGFHLVSPWGRNKKVQWSEITATGYSPWLQWHTIKTEVERCIFLTCYP